mmetsp:Transcript_71877/g.202953  ORF Transcript_71877/g.202953 Transcript_71877/m.202953 type:complete len:264 (+) Transcript_71877:276-1067(+)
MDLNCGTLPAPTLAIALTASWMAKSLQPGRAARQTPGTPSCFFASARLSARRSLDSLAFSSSDCLFCSAAAAAAARAPSDSAAASSPASPGSTTPTPAAAPSGAATPRRYSALSSACPEPSSISTFHLLSCSCLTAMPVRPLFFFPCRPDRSTRHPSPIGRSGASRSAAPRFGGTSFGADSSVGQPPSGASSEVSPTRAPGSARRGDGLGGAVSSPGVQPPPEPKPAVGARKASLPCGSMAAPPSQSGTSNLVRTIFWIWRAM